MYNQYKITTKRLTTAYYRTGEGNAKKLLLVHGNVSSSVFYLPMFKELGKDFDVIAPDLRCFGDSDALPVDATKGYGDWTADLYELTEVVGWDSFAIVGWSLGGCIAMDYAIKHSSQLTGVILINPGSPFGFGGTKGDDGRLLDPPGLGSGGGCANANLVKALLSQDRTLPKTTLDKVYFKPPFTMEPQWEELFIDSMLKTKVGEGMYPGDSRPAAAWPFVASGDNGICNTMAPTHANLSALANINPQPPILWVRGDSDIFVSDTSSGDFGFLGMCGVVPGWPGAEQYPPQPMLKQTRFVLNRYAQNGGFYRELIIPGGHGCHLESPEQFIKAVRELLE